MKTYRKGLTVLVTTLIWLSSFWILASLWEVLPSWTSFPIIMTGVVLAIIMLGFLVWAASEFPNAE